MCCLFSNMCSTVLSLFCLYMCFSEYDCNDQCFFVFSFIYIYMY